MIEELIIEGEELDMSLEPLEDAISEAISNITGYCHFGFTYKIVVEADLDKDEK